MRNKSKARKIDEDNVEVEILGDKVTLNRTKYNDSIFHRKSVGDTFPRFPNQERLIMDDLIDIQEKIIIESKKLMIAIADQKTNNETRSN